MYSFLYRKIADIFKGNVIIRANESCLSLANIVFGKDSATMNAAVISRPARAQGVGELTIMHSRAELCVRFIRRRIMVSHNNSPAILTIRDSFGERKRQPSLLRSQTFLLFNTLCLLFGKRKVYQNNGRIP